VCRVLAVVVSEGRGDGEVLTFFEESKTEERLACVAILGVVKPEL